MRFGMRLTPFRAECALQDAVSGPGETHSARRGIRPRSGVYLRVCASDDEYFERVVSYVSTSVRASTSPFSFTCPSCPLLPSAPFRVLKTPPEVKYWPLLLLPESPPYPFFLSSILHPLDIIFVAFLFLYFHYRPLHERLANARLCRPHGSPRRRPYRRLRRPHHHRVRGTPARRVPAKRAGAARTRDERVAGRPGRRDRKVSPTSDYLTP